MTEEEQSCMFDIARAYVAEFGDVPRSREEQGHYNAFRLGYEAGRRQGRLIEIQEQKLILDDRLDAFS